MRVYFKYRNAEACITLFNWFNSILHLYANDGGASGKLKTF